MCMVCLYRKCIHVWVCLFQPLQEKYAQLAFEETLRLPSLENLDQPVKYSEVRTSNNPYPPPSRPDPHEPHDNSQPSGGLGGDKHPLGEWCSMSAYYVAVRNSSWLWRISSLSFANRI